MDSIDALHSTEGQSSSIHSPCWSRVGSRAKSPLGCFRHTIDDEQRSQAEVLTEAGVAPVAKIGQDKV